MKHDQMTSSSQSTDNQGHAFGNRPILVIGSTGKIGRRIVDRLARLSGSVRGASRHSDPPFEWTDPATWDAVLGDAKTIYISYAPDLAIPGASDSIAAFVDRAVKRGAERLVLLSGRGEEEAQRCERIIQRPDVEWTVVRASWFNQNFSEGAFVDMVLAGEIALPAGDVAEPFVDADDIADVAVAALTEDGHAGEIYELTGPRLLTFAQATEEIARATGHSIQYSQIPHDAFIAGVVSAGLPDQITWILDYLFTNVLDGRNAEVTHDVDRALGREPRDFADYARAVAQAGVWR